MQIYDLGCKFCSFLKVSKEWDLHYVEHTSACQNLPSEEARQEFTRDMIEAFERSELFEPKKDSLMWRFRYRFLFAHANKEK